MNLIDTLMARLRRPWLEREARLARQALRRRCANAAQAAEALPPSVRASWEAHANEEFPGSRTDVLAWVIASTALAQFFEVCRLQADGQACGLPSRAADAIWHTALSHARTDFEAWQLHQFGQVVAHRENAELGAPPEEALARTWVWACRSEGRDPLPAGLPIVFAADARLRTPGGWAYDYDVHAMTVQHRGIDARGRLAPVPRLHTAMALPALGAAGMLTALEIAQLQAARAAWLRGEAHPRRKDDSAGGSACGGGCGSSGSAGDGGGGDGGSCGSSCGGGCGGGGD